MRILLRSLPFALTAFLVVGTSAAANDPFVGKWKVIPSKSKLIDEMKVEAVGANRYALTFGPGAVDTIVADGTDQPALQGTTLSLTVKGPNNWWVVRRKKGRILVTGDWTLSGDGKTLDDNFTAYPPDGSTRKLHYVYERTAGSAGFTGTWDSESEIPGQGLDFEIEPYEGDGLSFKGPALPLNGKMKLDGKDYPNPDAGPGSASSGHRVNERSLNITDTLEGKVTETRQIDLSTDLKTLTISVLAAGDSKPKNILVFERE